LTVTVWLANAGVVAAQGTSPTQLRRFIDDQVGGIEKLMVPAHDSDLPQPRLANGSLDPQFQITEAKRYLGKQLFHDPVRTARILPEFGGVPATKQTGSCGSCHMGESASKAGTLLNFSVGGEGRGYTDAAGNFIPRRRPRTSSRSFARRRCFPVTRWWTSCRRSPTSTSTPSAAPPVDASSRIPVRCCERAGWTRSTASRATRRA
jgi:hypothetical protein